MTHKVTLELTNDDLEKSFFKDEPAGYKAKNIFEKYSINNWISNVDENVMEDKKIQTIYLDSSGRWESYVAELNSVIPNTDDHNFSVNIVSREDI